MTDASSRGFERVTVDCDVDSNGVGAPRVLLAVPTSVASERTARRADRRGNISSPFWEDCLSDPHHDVSLIRLDRISGRTVRQNPVEARTLGSQSTPFVVCDRTFDPQNQGYQRAGLVTTDELALLKKVDRQPKAKIDSILLSDGQSYALLYLRLLNKLQRVDTMQCILVYIADALWGEYFKCDPPPPCLTTFQITMNGYPFLFVPLKQTQNSHTVHFCGRFPVNLWCASLTPYPALWTSKTMSSNSKPLRSSLFF